MKKGIVGIMIVVFAYLLILGVFLLLGGDAGQAKRSDWFPLVYILPGMVGLWYFFFKAEKNNMDL